MFPFEWCSKLCKPDYREDENGVHFEYCFEENEA